jgi:hypothetical protein
VKAAALALLLYAVAGLAAESEVRVVRLGTQLAPGANSDVVAKVIRLVATCSVDSTSYAASPSAWDSALASRSLVHVRFQAPRRLDLRDTQLAVDEILIPLPDDHWPAHFFVRAGSAIHAFTKYRPEALKDLVWDPPLALQTESPYAGLAHIPGG